jgi:hypothetical protein
MGKIAWCAVFVGLSWALAADPEGGVEARSESGHLAGVSSWWNPEPALEGRWWWREAGGGSAWIRAGAFQAGPLSVAQGTEGWRTWGPGTNLSSGHWGVGWAAEDWGLWAVQSPASLEAGAQGRVSTGALSLAAGADRTWALGLPLPAEGPWSDRVRAGVVLGTEVWRSGAEAVALIPAVGPRGWTVRGRTEWRAGEWRLEGAGAGGTDPDREPWKASGKAAWNGWSASWAGRSRDPAGQAEAGWRGGGWTLALRWGPQAGEGAAVGLETVRGEVKWAAMGEVRRARLGWDGKGGVSAAGRSGPDRWSAAWSVGPGREAPEQTVSAAWKRSGWEAELRWAAEGFTLGWIGPGQSFDLTVRWFF